MRYASALLINRYDYQETPEGSPYFQVIEGNLVKSPSLMTFHQVITGNIGVLICNFVEKHRLGETFIGPLDVYLDDINVYQPDVFFISGKRRNIIAEYGIEGAPDLVVETLSPATARYDKGSKRKVYARHGVKEFWLVDPQTRTVQIYLLTKDAQTPVATHGEKAAFESAVLPGLRVKAAAIFKSRLRK